jgi:hypothetical protein
VPDLTCVAGIRHIDTGLRRPKVVVNYITTAGIIKTCRRRSHA